MTIRFLGTGTSVGVPQIGCTCAVCRSADPRDRRRRTGLYVTTSAGAFLVDTPPEMREACLAYAIDRVDAIVLTHAHMDHIAGFDDVRRFNTLNGGTPMNCYASPETVDAMHRIFPYITEAANAQGLFRPMIRFTPVTGPFETCGARLTPVDVPHGPRTYGYLIEADGARVGYVSDCHDLPDEAVARFRHVDLMILNCLRVRPHPTHLDLPRTRALLDRIAPRAARLVHMCHDLSHADYLALLADRPTVRPAYDGETFDPAAETP